MDKPTLSVGIAGYEHDSNSIWYQKSVYFLCEVKCIPRAVYIWKKNGVVIADTDGTMHLKKLVCLSMTCVVRSVSKPPKPEKLKTPLSKQMVVFRVEYRNHERNPCS